MNKKLTAIAMGLVMLLAIGCKKENESLTYNPVGFWRGNAHLTHIAVVLKPNGTANLYALLMGSDTSTASLKGYGRYTVTGNSIRAYGVTVTNDTIFINASHQTNNLMTGLLYSTITVEAAPINLWRE